MAIGIQIKKPDHSAKPEAEFGSSTQSGESLHWFYYALLGLTFPIALMALFFYIQTRSV
jgi:hypothetical protein